MPKYSVEESVSVGVELERVRGIVRDFKQWPPWSPWLSAEPDCPIEYADDGKSYSWDGKIIGSGKMELVSETPEKLDYKLTFLTPFRSQADVAFIFEPAGSDTKVSWTMRSSLPFFMFFMLKMMKAWIASDYRRGLAKLKDYAETGSVPSQNEFVGEGEGLRSDYVGIRGTCKIEQLGRDMPPKYDRLKKWIDQSGTKPSAPPFAIYHKFDPVKGVAEYTAAIPVSDVPSELPTGFHAHTLSEPKTYRVRHVGAYRHLGSAWSAGMMRERAKVFKSAKGHAPFEIYTNDPATTPETELVTEIHFPAR